MPRWRRLVPWIALAALAGIAWWGLRQPPTAATWLRVTAPGEAVVGQDFPVRIRLRAAALLSTTPGLQLGVDLHGSTPRHEPRGWIGSAAPQAVTGADAELTFAIPVPTSSAPGFVHAVIFASPTGQWIDRVAVADSVDVALRRPQAGTPEPTWQALHVYDPEALAPVAQRDLPTIRIVLAIGWLTCAVAWWRRRARQADDRRVAGLLGATALVAAAWAALPMAEWLGRRARDFTLDRHWYGMRNGFQHTLTVAVAAVGAAIVMWYWRRTASVGQRLAVLGITLHATVTIASFLSLHAVDALLAARVGAVPLLQALQLAAVSLALLGAVSARRDESTVHPG